MTTAGLVSTCGRLRQQIDGDPESAATVASLRALARRIHPHDRPHWYLFILGTEQTAQGQGLGSALLVHMLARVDADGMPAYLESSNEQNLALYGRHDFEVTAEVVIPDGPRIWPMWRAGFCSVAGDIAVVRPWAPRPM